MDHERPSRRCREMTRWIDRREAAGYGARHGDGGSNRPMVAKDCKPLRRTPTYCPRVRQATPKEVDPRSAIVSRAATQSWRAHCPSVRTGQEGDPQVDGLEGRCSVHLIGICCAMLLRRRVSWLSGIGVMRHWGAPAVAQPRYGCRPVHRKAPGWADHREAHILNRSLELGADAPCWPPSCLHHLEPCSSLPPCVVSAPPGSRRRRNESCSLSDGRSSPLSSSRKRAALFLESLTDSPYKHVHTEGRTTLPEGQKPSSAAMLASSSPRNWANASRSKSSWPAALNASQSCANENARVRSTHPAPDLATVAAHHLLVKMNEGAALLATPHDRRPRVWLLC